MSEATSALSIAATLEVSSCIFPSPFARHDARDLREGKDRPEFFPELPLKLS
jgi:hypothetical protein